MINVYFVKNNEMYNYYDVIINQFEYIYLFFFYSFSFVILLYNFFSLNSFEKYINFRFKSKNNSYNINIIAIFLIALLFVAFLNIVTLIFSVGNTDFTNEFSQHFLMGINEEMTSFSKNMLLICKKITPTIYIFLLNAYILLYFNVLGNIFFICNICFKKKSISFIVTISLVFLNFYMESFGGIFMKLSMKYNIYFCLSPYTEIQNNLYIIYRFIYWAVIIVSLYFIGKTINKKFDYSYEE